MVAARPDRPHRDDGAGRLRQTLVEHGQARDAGSEVRLGDDRVTPVDRLGLMPRELHRHRPRHARALRARVSCWHRSSEQARTHPGTRAAIRERRRTVAGVERSVNPLRLLLRAGMGWGNLPAGTAAGNFLVVAAGGVGGEVVDTDDDGTEQ